ncbi:MAG TPA: hypothetical protein VE153_07140, partial [Myxococcus sp.]|nr:hypothetical protein [Myxococcus sp.]
RGLGHDARRPAMTPASSAAFAPTEDQVRRIVSAAARAPSAENCQPFTFQWDGRELSLLHDPERGRHRLNPRNHVSSLTLGFLLEALALAASAEGLRLEDTLHVPPSTSPVWATVRFAEGAGTDGLVDALQTRRTDRRLYRGGSLQAPVFGELRQEAGRFPGVGLYLAPRPEGEFLTFCLEADSLVWRDAAAYQDVLRWTRFSEEELRRTRDGFSWRSLGLPLPGLPGLRLTRHEAVRRALQGTQVYRASALWLRAQLASSAGLVCITAPPGHPEALVAAGRLALRAWLRLNRSGHAVQPMSLQSTPIYDLEVSGLPGDLPPGTRERYLRAGTLLARAFGYTAPELPVWMCRTGRAPPRPPETDTLRLPVERLLSIRERRG